MKGCLPETNPLNSCCLEIEGVWIREMLVLVDQVCSLFSMELKLMQPFIKFLDTVKLFRKKMMTFSYIIRHAVFFQVMV